MELVTALWWAVMIWLVVSVARDVFMVWVTRATLQRAKQMMGMTVGGCDPGPHPERLFSVYRAKSVRHVLTTEHSEWKSRVNFSLRDWERWIRWLSIPPDQQGKIDEVLVVWGGVENSIQNAWGDMGAGWGQVGWNNIDVNMYGGKERGGERLSITIVLKPGVTELEVFAHGEEEVKE